MTDTNNSTFNQLEVDPKYASQHAEIIPPPKEKGELIHTHQPSKSIHFKRSDKIGTYNWEQIPESKEEYSINSYHYSKESRNKELEMLKHITQTDLTEIIRIREKHDKIRTDRNHN